MYLMLGPPCVGKGTISNKLKAYNLVHLSAGNLLREEFPIGTETRNILDAGGLVSLDLICSILEKKIITNNFNVLIDGFPRSLDQAIFLKDFCKRHNRDIKAIFVLTADRANLIERLLKRTFCEKCNLTFAENLYCCNQLVGKRSDDTVTTFLKRLDVFYKDFDQILIELIGPIYFINTQHTIDQILITMDQIISK